MLYQLQRLYNVERNGKMIMNNEYEKGWKEVALSLLVGGPTISAFTARSEITKIFSQNLQ
jgi:hypothetical protein